VAYFYLGHPVECTIFVFGRGCALDHSRRAYSAPPDFIAVLRDLLLREGDERKKGKGNEGERTGETGSFTQIIGFASVC